MSATDTLELPMSCAALIRCTDLLGDLPTYKSNSTTEDREAKRVILRRQIQQLVTAPPEQQIRMTCICGHRAVVWMMYRCLYCGIFYCKECAERHFGARKPKFDEGQPNKKLSE